MIKITVRIELKIRVRNVMRVFRVRKDVLVRAI